jgi:hypothetical protein
LQGYCQEGSDEVDIFSHFVYLLTVGNLEVDIEKQGCHILAYFQKKSPFGLILEDLAMEDVGIF